MIKNRLLAVVVCEDDNDDAIELVEGINFNTKVLDLKSTNGEMVTHILLSSETAIKLAETLQEWGKGQL